MASKPTQRTMAELKSMGFTSQIVERWCAFSRRRVDLFNFADIVAIRDGVGILAIQTTSGTNHSARREKIIHEPKAKTWLDAGGRLEIWSWAKRGERGKRKLWELRREEVTAEMMDLTGVYA